MKALAEAKPQSLEQLQAWVEQRIAELHGEQDAARQQAMQGLADALKRVLRDYLDGSDSRRAQSVIQARAALEAARPFLTGT